MKYYYLLNGKIMSANEKMPDRNDDSYITSWHTFNNDRYNLDVKIWHSYLQPCEISESELFKVKKHINYMYDSNPIEVTDIVNASVICKVERCDGECIECNHMAIRIAFKHPKQVEEIEDVKLQFFKEFGSQSFRGYPLEQCHSIWEFFKPHLTRNI